MPGSSLRRPGSSFRAAALVATLCVAAVASAGGASAQTQPVRWTMNLDRGRYWPAVPRVVLDADDDDQNGILDRYQDEGIVGEDLAQLRFYPQPPAGKVKLSAVGGVRLVRDGQALGSSVVVRPGEAWPAVQGVVASRREGGAGLDVTTEDGSVHLPITVVALDFLDDRNTPIDAARRALGLSRQVTHDRTLPREANAAEPSPDRENFRVRLTDPALHQRTAIVGLESVDPRTGRVHHILRHVPAVATAPGMFRSPFLRLVGDRTDLSAPEVGDRLLAVRLRDRVRVRYRVGRTELHQDLRVGRPGLAGGPRAALQGTLRLRALRMTPGGVPVIGHTDMDAIGLLREQVQVANEIWLQCGIDFGDPAEADAQVVDPPPPALLAIADEDGLPAAGDGVVRFTAGERRIGPVRTRTGAAPSETALDVARALRAAGLSPSVTVNPRIEYGAGRSADVVVRDKDGAPVALSPWPDKALGTDSMQSVQIGSIDLHDGIQQFNNMTAAAGTLEERTLLKLLGDDDPTTVDIFVIHRFASPERQGEAFIEGDGGAIVNMLILDRNGIRFQRQAWVQSHELGHVLLDAPYHPDNVGPDRPWLLMDADARQGRVTGPKRVTAEECARVRRRSGPGASPVLLRPYPD